MKNIIARLFLITAITSISMYAYSQGGGGPLPPEPPQNPQGVPLDPLSWVMLASGAGVAGKKYYDSRKSKKHKEIEKNE
jgi:hypothetical protein